MSPFLEKANAYRASVSPHYNCAQAVAASFAETAGIDGETALRFAAGFGGGMRRGSVCGAVTGGLMALGMFGISDEKTLKEYHRRFQEAHGDLLDCVELLQAAAMRGVLKKTWCDGLVRDCVELVEAILRENGKLA